MKASEGGGRVVGECVCCSSAERARPRKEGTRLFSQRVIGAPAPLPALVRLGWGVCPRRPGLLAPRVPAAAAAAHGRRVVR